MAQSNYDLFAHPNPFNPATTISYQLVEDAMISLAIFDMNGKLVRRLVEGEKSAGLYSIRWNANDAEQKAASGLYVYRLIATPINGGQTFRASEKLLLTK
ncbi:T9SS C-terminal target domain-containing protein [candidate division KSB1 bacterium]|nr:MAG: T9SS C-terminal target domain-containing protein [candidate division KSB1 bacterium]MBC6950766.1 T9SS C-terminal target domain-containing protein [candidate division KSB1 bacterium]MCE7941888.1 T9SS C-terminal target domain-containing protein [Chlorobi bacterium CHB1]NUM76134.1 T9SS type A sorting domain-containing protein [candidate division KSB1 bacterium]